jgi:ribosomal protein S18 acetylase RimI-like enzyme
LPDLNIVQAFGSDPRPGVVGELLDDVASSGLPHYLEVRPGTAAALGDVARERGMELSKQHRLMVLEDRPVLTGKSEELEIRELKPTEVGIHVRVAAAGFEAGEEHFAQFMPPSMLEPKEIRCYVGEVDGEPVVTGLGVTVGDHVGIFSVATVPQARRRGYGTAITTRAIEDGREAGAAWVWLQSSPSAYRLYERLGFREIESWDVWVANA